MSVAVELGRLKLTDLFFTPIPSDVKLISAIHTESLLEAVVGFTTTRLSLLSDRATFTLLRSNAELPPLFVQSQQMIYTFSICDLFRADSVSAFSVSDV
jgi:hypothetical protein